MLKFTEETDEYLPVEVFNQGQTAAVKVTSGVEFSIVEAGSRPILWTPAYDIDGTLHVRVAGLQVGAYRVWVRVTASIETSVIVAGEFFII